MHLRRPPASRPNSVAGAVLHLCVLSWVGAGQLARRCAPRSLAARAAGQGRDRGDVPGWVLVTLMTAGLVTVLWVLARDRLSAVFERAISSVAGS